MNREQGVRGVQIATGGYIRCKNRWTAFAFGAGAQIRCSPWVKSALLGKGEIRWEDLRDFAQTLEFPEF